MKFLQIHTFYPQYIDSIYSKFKLLNKASFQEQIDVLITDAFSAAHIISPYMTHLGYESHLIVANCLPSQIQWLKENNILKLNTNDWIHEIAKIQIEIIEPDILYLSDPILFDGNFIAQVNHKPRLIMGWRAARFPYNINWNGFDVMLSSLKPLLNLAIQRGVKRGELFAPGFPTNILNKIRHISPSKDIVFIGQCTIDQHLKRKYYLTEIIKHALNKKYTCSLHLAGQTEGIPKMFHQFISHSAYGLEMYKALRKGKIAFDSRGEIYIFDKNNTKIDIAGKHTANMRIFEATGSGVFLLTEHCENLNQYFEIGKEIETFSNKNELIEKIDFYIAHPEKREEIAHNGQKRCLKEHSMEKRAKNLDEIIQKNIILKEKSKNKEISSTTKSKHMYYIKSDIPSKIEQLYSLISLQNTSSQNRNNLCGVILNFCRTLITQSHYNDCLRLASQIKALRIPMRDLDLIRAMAFLGLNQTANAREALKEELRYFPDNTTAAQYLQKLSESQNEMPVNLPQEFKELFAIIQPYTMLSTDRLYSLYTIAKTVCQEDIDGNIVECGVAAGGSAALLAATIKKYSKRRRWLYAFDSFEGMPKPGEHDFHESIDAESTGWGTGTCAAPIESVITATQKVGAKDILVPIKGYFQDTLPKLAPVIGPIALLHMDGDWYESTRDILIHCWDLVVPGGMIQIDDFGFWAGCRKAVNEFLTQRGIVVHFESIDDTGVRLRKPETLT
jgi:hypothetical protein